MAYVELLKHRDSLPPAPGDKSELKVASVLVSPWPADGHLLAVSSHGFSSVCLCPGFPFCKDIAI